MGTKKEVWIEANEAASIMTKNSGHPVSIDYVRLLSNQGKLQTKPKDRRTKLYLLSDVEKYRVRGKGKNNPATQVPQGADETPEEKAA